MSHLRFLSTITISIWGVYLNVRKELDTTERIHTHTLSKCSCIEVTKYKAMTSGKSYLPLDPVERSMFVSGDAVVLPSVKVAGRFPPLAPQMKHCPLVSMQGLLHCPLGVVAPSEDSAGGFDYKSVSISERNHETFGNLIIKLKM